MGPEFLKPHIVDDELVTDEENILNVVYWPVKYCLLREGIESSLKKIDHERLITLRSVPK
jgi:hypothetical protein